MCCVVLGLKNGCLGLDLLAVVHMPLQHVGLRRTGLGLATCRHFRGLKTEETVNAITGHVLNPKPYIVHSVRHREDFNMRHHTSSGTFGSSRHSSYRIGFFFCSLA